MGAALIGLIAVVFPTRAEYAHLSDIGHPDHHSLAYLAVLVRASPKDVDLRLVYVRQLADIGRFADAIAALGPALDDPRTATTAFELQLDLKLSLARSLPEGSAERAKAFAAVVELLPTAIARAGSVARLEALETLAASLEKPVLSAEAVLRMVELSPPDKRAELRARAAKWFLSGGAHARAAELLSAAALSETDLTKAKQLAVRALAAFEAHDVHAAADMAAIFAKRWWTDAAIVAEGARLAEAAGRARTARDFGRQLVTLGPVTEALLRKQAKRELAAGDPNAALSVVDRLIALSPNDPALRENRAHIAEWAAKPETALADWLWLLDRGWEPKGLSL
jgi:hypothetical protein